LKALGWPVDVFTAQLDFGDLYYVDADELAIGSIEVREPFVVRKTLEPPLRRLP